MLRNVDGCLFVIDVDVVVVDIGVFFEKDYLWVHFLGSSRDLVHLNFILIIKNVVCLLSIIKNISSWRILFQCKYKKCSKSPWPEFQCNCNDSTW